MSPKISIKQNGEGLNNLKKALATLTKKEVLVGIPAEEASRKGEGPNNAELAFIHTLGSPLRNIPARPFLEPAINDPDNRKLINAQLEQAAKAALEGDEALLDQKLNLAGTVASNAAKQWFTSSKNNWAPNAPATIAQKGSDKPLIDTAQLRRAVNHIVKDK